MRPKIVTSVQNRWTKAACSQDQPRPLAGGHTFSLPDGIDSSELGVPEELVDWVKIAPEA
jgi:hypothetical protein